TENSGHKENVVLLGQGTQDEVFSSLGYTDTGDIGTQPGIARDARNLPLVSKETYVIVNQPVVHPIPGRPKRRFLQARGIEDPLVSAQVHVVDLYEQGQWFSPSGARRAANDPEGQRPPLIEAVIGEGIARTLGRDRSEEELAAAKNPLRL